MFKFFSDVAIGLSVVFGCILIALVAALYDLLWRKKRKRVTNDTQIEIDYTKTEDAADLELGSSKESMLKSFAGEEGVEAELMRLHNLSGPRFLFPIKEETREDLESDDGKSRKGSRGRSLSDVMVANNEIHFLSPLSSPPMKSPLLGSYGLHEFNPLFDSSEEEAELVSRLRSSPPPMFKFLRDAEEKLYIKLMEETQKRVPKSCGTNPNSNSNS